MVFEDRPYVILSAAMTIDGKIASRYGDVEISDEQDWLEVHKLRTQVDAIMVGKKTILKDDPKLHIKYYDHNGYHRIVADSNLTIPLSSKVITYKPDIYPTIICTTENVPKERIEKYENKGVKIITSGIGNRVDIKKALYALKNIGIKSILLEGGGNLNWSFIKYDLINEIRLTIAPWIIGGKDAISLVEGEGFDRMKNARRFKFMGFTQRDNYIVLKYKRDEQWR